MSGKTKVEDQPLVSIITAVLNGEKHIEQTISSVLNQSYKNIEYIIIDGGSNDNTINIIKKYEKQIDHWISEADEGLYHAINKGIKLAKGNIIGILHSNDFYFEKSVQYIVDANLSSAEEIIFHGDIEQTNEKENSKPKRMIPDLSQMHYKQSIFHPTCFVKKSVYEKYGTYDTQFKIASDYDFLLRCMKQGVKFQYIPKAITSYRSGGMSTSYKCDFECYRIQKKYQIPNPYKYLYRGIKCYIKPFLSKEND